MTTERIRPMKLDRPGPITLVILMVLAFPEPARASPNAGREDRNVQEQLLAACIRRAAQGKTWLERTLWALRDQEAGWVGAQVPNRDGSHDLGPLQVNSWWVNRVAAETHRPPAHIRYWLMHDACFNVEVARWIFLSGLSVTGDYWAAVGAYHSPGAWRQRRYASAIARKLRRRFGDNAFRTRWR